MNWKLIKKYGLVWYKEDTKKDVVLHCEKDIAYEEITTSSSKEIFLFSTASKIKYKPIILVIEAGHDFWWGFLL